MCVKLCKVATYMKPEDNSVLCFLVVTMLNELKVLSTCSCLVVHQADDRSPCFFSTEVMRVFFVPFRLVKKNYSTILGV